MNQNALDREREFRIHWDWEDGCETRCQPEPEAVVDESIEHLRTLMNNGGPEVIIRNPRKQWRWKAIPAGEWQEAAADPTGAKRTTAPDNTQSIAEVVFDIMGSMPNEIQERWWSNSRDLFQSVFAWALEFEKAHPLPWGEGNYPNDGTDDYILAVEEFTERKIQEMTGVQN